ncbi:hypothetical protein BGP_2772 [Beggiatoa sp. PS]|nr:hypothetical protein BGP_2772 [Beggiatoa sp. PS]
MKNPVSFIISFKPDIHKKKPQGITVPRGFFYCLNQDLQNFQDKTKHL